MGSPESPSPSLAPGTGESGPSRQGQLLTPILVGRNAAGKDGRERRAGSVLEQVPFLQNCEDEDSDDDDELDSGQHKKARGKVGLLRSAFSASGNFPPLLLARLRASRCVRLGCLLSSGLQLEAGACGMLGAGAPPCRNGLSPGAPLLMSPSPNLVCTAGLYNWGWPVGWCPAWQQLRGKGDSLVPACWMLGAWVVYLQEELQKSSYYCYCCLLLESRDAAFSDGTGERGWSQPSYTLRARHLGKARP